jgi:hypothetical protein
MASVRADEALVILLDHNNRDVVFAAIGALVNLASDPVTNGSLVSAPHPAMDNGCAKLVTLMRRAGLKDWPLAAVAAKALFNALGRVDGALDIATIRLLHDSLDELLDASDQGEFSSCAAALLAVVRGMLSSPSPYESLPETAPGAKGEV